MARSLAIVLLLALSAPAASACETDVSLESLADTSELIISGAVVGVEPGGEPRPDNYRCTPVVVRIDGVIKGTAAVGDDVRVASFEVVHPYGPIIICPAPHHYSIGDEGIWCLRRCPNPRLWRVIATYGAIYNRGDRAAFEAALRYAAALKETGIEIMLECERPRTMPGKPLAVRVIVRNRSQSTLTLAPVDLAEASLVSWAPGLVSTNAVRVLLKDGETIAPKKKAAVLELEATVTGAYDQVVSVQWGERVSAGLRIKVLPERHRLAQGAARDFLDRVAVEGNYMSAETRELLDAACARGRDRAFVREILKVLLQGDEEEGKAAESLLDAIVSRIPGEVAQLLPGALDEVGSERQREALVQLAISALGLEELLIDVPEVGCVREWHWDIFCRTTPNYSPPQRTTAALSATIPATKAAIVRELERSRGGAARR